jgi:hypothetical protein
MRKVLNSSDFHHAFLQRNKFLLLLSIYPGRIKPIERSLPESAFENGWCAEQKMGLVVK